MTSAAHVGMSGFASPASSAQLDAASGAGRERLEAYARRYSSVEMDSCFLREPGRATVESWKNATPEGFTFAVRVPREWTYVDRLARPAEIAGFAAKLAGLGSRLGCLLFTMPSTFVCDVEAVRNVLDALPDGVRTAWEFRHPSCFRREMIELLTGRGAALAMVDTILHNGSGPDPLDTAASEACFVYVRLRREGYHPSDLLEWGEILGKARTEGCDVFAYFRQTPQTPAYVRALRELLSEGLAHQVTR